MMTDIGEEAAIAEVHPIYKFQFGLLQSNFLIKNIEKSESMADITNISNKLAKGLLSNYEKPVENIKQELDNLKSKQEKCIMQLQLENKKLCDAQEDIELHDLFATIELYQKKLMNIKKEIVIIHDRTLKLKKRATRFQQIKQKEIVHKEQNEQD